MRLIGDDLRRPDDDDMLARHDEEEPNRVDEVLAGIGVFVVLVCLFAVAVGVRAALPLLRGLF